MRAVFGANAAVDAHNNFLCGRVHDNVFDRASRNAALAAGAFVGDELNTASDAWNEGFVGTGFGTGRVLAGSADVSGELALHTTSSFDADSCVLWRVGFHEFTGTGEAAGIAGDTFAHAGRGENFSQW